MILGIIIGCIIFIFSLLNVLFNKYISDETKIKDVHFYLYISFLCSVCSFLFVINLTKE
jgi:uncharacterized membrane protein YhaH (DUF805 family)